ncbi:unnamed protein product [Agarophyton chilense]
MSTTFASSSSPHPANMLSLPLASPPDPLAAYDPLTLLDDSFQPYASRQVNPALPRLSPPHLSVPSYSQSLPSNNPVPTRNPRPPLPSPPTAANGPSVLSPRAYGLSPRLPSALPPSASPRVVEPVTPDRQPLPFSADDAAVLCERVPIGTVDERAAAFIFDSVPRRPLSCPSSTVPTADASTQQEKFSAMSLQLPIDPSLTAPPPQVHSLSMPSHQLTTSSSLVMDTSSATAAASAAAVTASNSAQNALSPFGLSTRQSTAAAIAAAVDNPAFHPWNKDNDQVQNIPSSIPKTEPTSNSAFAATTTAAAVAAAQAASSLCAATHRPAPASAVMSSMSLPDPSLFPSPAVAQSLCTFTQLPDFLQAPPTTSSISDQSMQITRPRAEPTSNRHVSDESSLRKPVCIPKRPMLHPLGVSTTIVAADTTSDRLRCQMCGQRFARRSNLFKHLRSVHDDRRRFACRSCPYKFKRQDHLLKHMRSVHDRMRNFVCDICGFGFAEKFNRDKHRRSIHMTKRAFQCPCGAYFQDREKMLKCLRCRQPPNTDPATADCVNGVGAATL